MSAIDRSAFIAGLHTERLKPDQIEAFFGGLGERIPGPGKNPDRLPVLAAITERLQALGRLVHLPARGLDDDGALAEAINERMKGFGSERWTEQIDGVSLLDHARAAVGEIAADLAELRALPLDP